MRLIRQGDSVDPELLFSRLQRIIPAHRRQEKLPVDIHAPSEQRRASDQKAKKGWRNWFKK